MNPMELTLGRIVAAKPAIEELITMKIPIKASFKLTKIVKSELTPAMEVFENKRTEIMKNVFGKEQFTEEEAKDIDEEKQMQFATCFNEMLEETIEVNIDPLEIDELGDEASISAATLMTLDFLFAV